MFNTKFVSHLLLIGVVIASNVPGAIASSSVQVKHRKIVVFDSNVSANRKMQILAEGNADTAQNLVSVNGKVVYTDDGGEATLRTHPEVLRVDDDVILESMARRSSMPVESIPDGVLRTHADRVWNISTGDPIRVAVLDSGIDLTHEDLAANIKGGINTVRPGRVPNDDNGHGSHIAGTIGAVDNTVGVVGIAPNVDLFAVKVLKSNGAGFLSDIIAGIDWAIANNMHVINMSLGGPMDIPSLHDAVIRAKNAGITIVAASGNTGGKVMFPAAYPEVIAVGATDNTDQLMKESSRGPELDLVAPGVKILSTYKKDKYRLMTGTSMSTSHVTGVVALMLAVPSVCDTNRNGSCSPDEVRDRLTHTADDIGAGGFDTATGFGVVNAQRALGL